MLATVCIYLPRVADCMGTMALGRGCMIISSYNWKQLNAIESISSAIVASIYFFR